MFDVNERAETTGVTFSPEAPPGSPPHRDAPLRDHALWYATERHWDVLPGTWLTVAKRGVPECSCGLLGCDAPGAHPMDASWPTRATSNGAAVRRAWTECPRASILLPTGRTFDVLDVPETAGCLALARMERMGVALGPVSSTPYGRMMYFVLPGGAAKASQEALRQAGYTPGAIDIRPRGEGELVPAPPTRMGTRGGVLWVREPTTANRWLPDAAELLPVLAYACAREPH